MSLVDKFLALGLSKKAARRAAKDREEEREEDVMSALYKTGTVAWIRIAKDSEWILAYARDYTWVYLLAGTTRLGNGSISPLTAPAQIQIAHLPDATQPEGETDAYVEPEPLKEGWRTLVEQADKPTRYRFTDRDRVQFDGWATVKVEADGMTLMPVTPLTIDPNDEDGAVAELAHAIAEHCGVSVTFADLAKALAERSAAEGGAS